MKEENIYVIDGATYIVKREFLDTGKTVVEALIDYYIMSTNED